MTSQRIFFRVDGGSVVGLGHLVRSIALFEMLDEKYDVHFIIRNPPPKVKFRIRELFGSVIELDGSERIEDEVEELIARYFRKNDIVVLDNYKYNSNYQLRIKQHGCYLVSIDDIFSNHFYSDLIINHAPGIMSSWYSAEPYTQYCLGLDYALLRTPFIKNAGNPNNLDHKRMNRVMVCLGGADPQNSTLKVIESLCKSQYAEIYVIVGEAYLFRSQLDSFIDKSDTEINVLQNITDTEMLKIMMLCGIAILSPSTISIEYLSIGGVLYLYKIANNQNHLFDYFLNNNFANEFSLIDTINENKNVIQAPIVDGQQRKRINRVFTSLTLQIREANLQDVQLYYQWINDHEVRINSYSSKHINFDEHRIWFETRLNSSHAEMYVVSLENEPIGQIRFENKRAFAILSFSLDKKYRGQGLSESLLRRGLRYFRTKINGNLAIHAFVKKDNAKSINSFRALGALEEIAKEYPDSFKYIL